MDALTYAQMYATNMHGTQKYGVVYYTHHLQDVEMVLREFGPLPHVRFQKNRDEGKKIRIFGSNEIATIREFNGLPEVAMAYIDGRPHEPQYVHADNGSLCDETGPTEEDMLVAAWLHDVVEDTPAQARDIEELFGDWPHRLVAAVTSEDGPNRRTRVALTLPKTRAAGIYAVRLKLADRIANGRKGGGMLRKYVQEYPEFRHGLHAPGENEDMWAETDRLFSFKGNRGDR